MINDKGFVDAYAAIYEKKEEKRWQDDDGDGKWYEKSDVDGKLSKREKEEIKKKQKKEEVQTEGNQRNPEGSIKDRFKSKQTDPSKDNFTGIGDSIADIMKQNAAMKKAAAKKTKKEEEEIDEGIGRTIKKAKRIAKRMGDAWDDDPGRAHTIGTLGNPHVGNEDKRAAERKAGKKKVKEEIEIDEAERTKASRLERKRKLYDKTAKKAMRDAMETGEASGHNRYRMSSISREYDALKARRDKKEK